MIVAGIDEAGYGPLLGPLVVGCSAWDVGQAEFEAPPCIWKRLSRSVSKTRSKSGRKLHINDSKLVYSPSAGLKELERSVLAVLGTLRDWPATLDQVLSNLASDAAAELAAHPWYLADGTERFPLEQEPMSIRVLCNGLRAAMQHSQTRCVHLAARVLPERQLNRLFEATRNKSSVLFSQAATHLDYLLRNFASQGLVVFCDQQGGREHYGHLLRVMFEDWSLEVVREGDGFAEYRLAQGLAAARIVFCEKAEAQCLAVAMASMISKYLRESLMRRFNAWWQRLLPDLTPTAGYYQDGTRFLQDIGTKRQELGIADADLIRSR